MCDKINREQNAFKFHTNPTPSHHAQCLSLSNNNKHNSLQYMPNSLYAQREREREKTRENKKNKTSCIPVKHMYNKT